MIDIDLYPEAMKEPDTFAVTEMLLHKNTEVYIEVCNQDGNSVSTIARIVTNKRCRLKIFSKHKEV